MTPVIVTMPSGFHLAKPGDGITLCGESVGRWLTAGLTAGSDFGEHHNDCKRCVAALERKR